MSNAKEEIKVGDDVRISSYKERQKRHCSNCYSGSAIYTITDIDNKDCTDRITIVWLDCSDCNKCTNTERGVEMDIIRPINANIINNFHEAWNGYEYN